MSETLEARILTGGQAVAEAMRQIDPDVVPAYPITPQTPMIQGYAAFVAQGRAHGELVDVGQVICIVEAMKMENEVRAHRAGTVTGLAVEAGQPVASGQIICSITDQ